MAHQSSDPEFGAEELPAPLRHGTLADELTKPQDFHKSVVRRLLYLSCIACDLDNSTPGIVNICTTNFGDSALGAIWLGVNGSRHIDIVFRGIALHTQEGPSNLRNWVQQLQDPSVKSQSPLCWFKLDDANQNSTSETPQVLTMFQQSYEMLRAHVQKWFEDTCCRGDVVTVSGHSFGAAIATLCAAELSTKTAVQLVTFASPRVGNAAFCVRFTSSNIRVARFICRCDLVTNLPFEDVGARHVEDCTLIDAFVASTSTSASYWEPLRFHSIENYAKCMENLFRPPLNVVAELGFEFLPVAVPLLIRSVAVFGPECLTNGLDSNRKIMELMQESAFGTLQTICKLQEELSAELERTINHYENTTILDVSLAKRISPKFRCALKSMRETVANRTWIRDIQITVEQCCTLVKDSQDAPANGASVVLILKACCLELRALAVHGFHERLWQRMEEIAVLVRPLVESSFYVCSSDSVKELDGFLGAFRKFGPDPHDGTGVSLVSAKDRARNWLRRAERAFCDARLSTPPFDVQESIKALEGMSMLAALVGPESTEKSDLVSSLFGLPATATNKASLLPIIFIADSAAQHFRVVLRGQGLQDCMAEALQGVPLEGLTPEEALAIVRRCSDCLQQRIEVGKLRTANFHDFASWCFLIVVPRVRRQVALVLCPDPKTWEEVQCTELLEATSLWLQFQVRRCGLLVFAAPSSELNLLLEPARLRSLFGGPPPPKPALLTITNIMSASERDTAAEWLIKHTPTIGCLQILRCLFVNCHAMLAHALLVRTSLPIAVKQAYEVNWSDNRRFACILDNFLDSELPDLFLSPVRERLLHTLQYQRQKKQHQVKNISAPIEEVALRQAKLEAVLRRMDVLRQLAYRSLCDGQDMANARIRAAAEILGMEGLCLDTAEKQRNFENRLMGIADLSVANACMDAVNLFWSGRTLTRDTTEGLVFSSRAAAAPLVHAFVSWASRVACSECSKKHAIKNVLAWLESALGERVCIHERLHFSTYEDQSVLEQAHEVANDTVKTTALKALHSYQFAALPVHNIGGSINMLFWPFASASSCHGIVDEDMSRVSSTLVQDFDDIWSKADGEVVVFQKTHWRTIGLDTVQTVIEATVHELITSVETQLSEALDAVKASLRSSPTSMDSDEASLRALEVACR